MTLSRQMSALLLLQHPWSQGPEVLRLWPNTAPDGRNSIRVVLGQSNSVTARIVSQEPRQDAV